MISLVKVTKLVLNNLLNIFLMIYWILNGCLTKINYTVFSFHLSSLPPQVIELPLLNPELFLRVGITPPKGCLLYGPPGTGKTLLARAVSSQLDANFLKVISL